MHQTLDIPSYKFERIFVVSISRFRSPDKVNIMSNGGMQVNISSQENNNPLYESGENHEYCTIEDAQNEYKKEIGLSNKLSQSTLYETPMDPGASTSSFNQCNTKKSTNLYEVSELATPNPANVPQKDNAYEAPIDQSSSFNPLYPKESNNKNPNLELSSSPLLSSKNSTQKLPLLPKSHDTPKTHYKSPGSPDATMLAKKDTSSPYVTPMNAANNVDNNAHHQPQIPKSDHTSETHYKTPGNPYDTMLPKKDAASPYDVTPINAANNQRPYVPYENASNANNDSHYQRPKPGTDVYEVMRGRERQVDLADKTGMTQC